MIIRYLDPWGVGLRPTRAQSRPSSYCCEDDSGAWPQQVASALQGLPVDPKTSRFKGWTL